MFDVHEIGGAIVPAHPIQGSSRHTDLPQADPASQTALLAPVATPLSDHPRIANHRRSVAQSLSDDGLDNLGARSAHAVVGNLTMEVRRYTDLRRAKQRLLLQAMAMCRYACDGDKAAGTKLYREVIAGPKSEAATQMLGWLLPYLSAMDPLDVAIAQQEKTISKLARQLPVWEWVKGVRGLSDRFLGIIVGECSHPVGEFKSVAAVWKRMGLAVINGERQRRVTGDAALEHGYVARRRAIMWNVGESLIKAQVRKDESDARFPIGYFGAVYLERKAYELTRTDSAALAHNRAKRFMEKRLLRELYRAWRAA